MRSGTIVFAVESFFFGGGVIWEIGEVLDVKAGLLRVGADNPSWLECEAQH